MSADKTVSAEVLAGSAQGAKPWARWLGPIAVGVALFSALLTFVVLAGLTRIVADASGRGRLPAGAMRSPRCFWSAVIGREVWLIIQARRRGRAAAQLHVSIVGLFSVIAAVPAILVAIVALDHARSRPRPHFQHPHPRGDREFARGVGSLSARPRADRPRRHRHHLDRHRARQAAFRYRPRALPAIPDRAGVAARPSGRGHDRQKSGRDRAQQYSHQPGIHCADQGSA